jgi:cellulose synthase/poly-beta-1,6-N-acetylglucosamine synthase-like glycosyltransferase/CheY-like chemotaxis protein/GGDEF domain-containing protein
MNPNSAASAMPADPALILIVGDTAAGREAVNSPTLSRVTAVSVPDGSDVARRISELAPDLVVVGYDRARDATGDVVRQLRAQPGDRPPVVVIGMPEGIDGPGATRGDGDQADAVEEYLPDDVSTSELIDRIHLSLARPAPPPAAPRRPAITEQRLTEEIGRELRRAEFAQRPGVLAAVGVAELPRLRERLGPYADRVAAAAFDELFALDATILEQHSPRSGGGFWLLMPETGVAAARDRLERLARRVVGTVLDIAGEQARMTPVIGFASFAGAASSPELRDHADTALRDADIHLDLVPALYSRTLTVPPPAKRDLLLSMANRLRLPLQILFTTAMLLSLPFIVYVLTWYAGFDLTTVTYPLMSVALALTATTLWIENFLAAGQIEVPPMPGDPFPPASAIVAAYLPNEAATIVETVTQLLSQDYPGDYQVILAYNSPRRLPIEDKLEDLADRDSRLLLLRVETSTSKAQNVNAALAHVRGEFVGVFDADHHPAQGSFTRAWRWLADGHDIVQGHCVVRNGTASWLARLIAVEFEAVHAVSHPGRARLHGFGIFGGSNGYWRREALRQVRMHREMLTEDIDSSMRSLRAGFMIVSDPGLVSTELAPITIRAFWHQRMRWAQGWTQNARRHLVPLLQSRRLTTRQKLGASFLLGWVQVIPWVTIQVIPILAFNAWHDGSLGHIDWLIPLFVLLSLYTLTVGIAQTVFAYVLGDPQIRRHPGWFVLYAIHSTLWFGELKNLIARVAHLKELIGERQWRITPRGAAAPVRPADQVATIFEAR